MASSVPELSIIIPSVRPESLKKCLARIYLYDSRIDYEIVVIAPFEPKAHPRLRHIPESAPIGTARATNLGFQHCRGEFALTIADDMLLNPVALGNLMELMRRHKGELFLGSLRGYSAHLIWVPGGFYGFNLAYCPCLERRLVDRINGVFFDPIFRTAYNDHDLSLRVIKAGGQVEICRDAWFESISIEDLIKVTNTSEDRADDHKTFFNRWEPIHGRNFNYARTHAEHLGNSNIVREPLKGDLPPEYSWQLRKRLELHDWEGIAEIIHDQSLTYCVSENGINQFAALAFRSQSGMPPELFEELTGWICSVH